MTDKEKLEAIRALLNGEFDNKQLVKIGPLFVDGVENILHILNF